MDSRIKRIRESEKKSHIKMYSCDELYQTENWLKKPIKTVQEIIPLFEHYKKLSVLDLGCGVGRNSISIACKYKTIDCVVECVDILDLAIEKLCANAKAYGVASNICGIVKPIEEYLIQNTSYDLIIAVSALEHVESKDAFVNKLIEIRNGVRKNGVVCLVINSDVKEREKATGIEMPAQFEVNLPVDELQTILSETFAGWDILKRTVQEQQYDIPREYGISDLRTSVVSLVVRR